MLPLKKIVCPTDFSEPSLAALETACELAPLLQTPKCECSTSWRFRHRFQRCDGHRCAQLLSD